MRPEAAVSCIPVQTRLPPCPAALASQPPTYKANNILRDSESALPSLALEDVGYAVTRASSQQDEAR